MLIGFRLFRRPTRHCANRRCGDRLPTFSRWELCPSCRLAYGRGALLAAVAGAALHWVLR